MTITNLRPDLAGRLTQRLQAFSEGFRHNLAILGPPGSGKTFQLQQLLARHPDGLMLVYCPLYRESCRGFLQRLLCAILQAGLPATGRAEPSAADPEPLTRLLERAQTQLPRTASAVRAVDSLIARRLHGEAFNRALDVIPVLIEERRAPCVLILDEFLFLEDLGLGHAFHELGKRVMTWPSTLFILTSSTVYRARAILRERLQLLFGQFEFLTLEALDAGTASAWAQQELKGLRKAGSMHPFLISWLGASPWYLTVFLNRFKELAALRRSTEVTEPLFLQTAWDVLGSPEGPLHHWCVLRTEALARGRVGARALEALLQVAQGVRTMTEIGARVGRAELSGALQHLANEDIAQRNGMCWVIPDPVLRCWLSTVLLAQRADARLSASALRQRFEQHLRTLWDQWLQTHQLSLPERVVNLFAKFGEETVTLDSKTGRLPKFEAITTHQAGGGAYVIADGQGRRWCASVSDGPVDENAISRFETFCRQQAPKPSRKVVISTGVMEQNARLLAKTVSMWVWQADDLRRLQELYTRSLP